MARKTRTTVVLEKLAAHMNAGELGEGVTATVTPAGGEPAAEDPGEGLLRTEIATKDRIVDAATLRHQTLLDVIALNSYSRALARLAADIEKEERDAAEANTMDQQSMLFPTEPDALFSRERDRLAVVHEAVLRLRDGWDLDEE